MSFSFESEGLDDEVPADTDQEELDAAVDEVVSQVEDRETEEVSDDQYMLEVDSRLEVAHFYRLLLRNSLFSEASDASEVVERKVRGFIRSQLEELMGIRQPAKVVEERKPMPADVLNDDEVRALKMVASKLIRKPELAEVKPVSAPATPPAPKLAPKPPAVKPAMVATAKPAVVTAKAPPGKKKPGPKRATPTEKVELVEHPDHPGHMVEQRKQKIQKPAGYVPMPTDNNAMGAVLQQRAYAAGSLGESNMPIQTALANLLIKQG